MTIPAIRAVGVVYGTNMFFAVVGRPALIAAANRGESRTDARQLQRRWDSVIVPLALLLGLALILVLRYY